MQEMWVQSLGGEDSMEENMVITHSSILVWEIPWSEESGGLHSMESQRGGLDWATEQCLQTPYWIHTADTLTLNTHPSCNAAEQSLSNTYLLHKTCGNLKYPHGSVPQPSYFKWCNHEPKAQKCKQLFRPGEGHLFRRRQIKQEGRGPALS